MRLLLLFVSLTEAFAPIWSPLASVGVDTHTHARALCAPVSLVATFSQTHTHTHALVRSERAIALQVFLFAALSSMHACVREWVCLRVCACVYERICGHGCVCAFVCVLGCAASCIQCVSVCERVCVILCCLHLSVFLSLRIIIPMLSGLAGWPTHSPAAVAAAQKQYNQSVQRTLVSALLVAIASHLDHANRLTIGFEDLTKSLSGADSVRYPSDMDIDSIATRCGNQDIWMCWARIC